MKALNTVLAFCVVANIWSNQSLLAQGLNQNVAKNTIYLEAGLTYGLIITVNYDRLLLRFGANDQIKFHLRASAGVWFEYAQYPYGSFSIPILFGNEHRHFEIGLGIASYYNWHSYNQDVDHWERWSQNPNNPLTDEDPKPTMKEYIVYVPAITLGYRKQKPNGGPVFRVGLGWPNGLYFSYGWCF